MAGKKTIESWSDYDRTGMWCLHIHKKRGKLTLDEIREACMEWDEDFYMLVINAMVEHTIKDGDSDENR